jgi:hypothetical protein
MPPWAISILKWLGLELLNRGFAFLKNWLKEKNEERKTIKELKAKVKQLKDSKTPEEIRAAIRDLNL